MSSYFDQVEQGMCEVVERRAHRPWHVRLRQYGHARGLLVIIAALCVATPAVGAATNWFGFALGKPDQATPGATGPFTGQPITATRELLSLRVPDPQGGPPWGLGTVRTSGDETCLVIGRVEGGRLGSLGIDRAWHDDHQFHPFPADYSGLFCGPDDAHGQGLTGGVLTGVSASASDFGLLEHSRGPGPERIVFTGLLGPQVTSITYLAPDGKLKQERTGADGAYLLVFPVDGKTCKLYTGSACHSGESGGGARFPVGAAGSRPSPIRVIHYQNGKACQPRSVDALQSLQSRFGHYIRRFLPSGWGADPQSWPSVTPALRQAVARFLATRHISLTRLAYAQAWTSCPPVGYTPEHALTRRDVASTITVSDVHVASQTATMTLTLTPRQPSINGGSHYHVTFSSPTSCHAARGSGEVPNYLSFSLDFSSIKRLGSPASAYTSTPTPCRGTYRGTVTYIETTMPFAATSGSISALRGRSIPVGHFSFTVS